MDKALLAEDAHMATLFYNIIISRSNHNMYC